MRRLLYLLMMAGTGIGLWQLSEKATPSVNSVQDVEQKADFSDISLTQEDPSAIEAVKQKEVPLKKDEIAIIPLHPKPILINSPVNPVMEAEVLAYEEWKSKPEFREVKNINPPIPGVEAPAKAVMLNPEDLTKPNIVDLGFGAFLHIPADALVMDNGEAPTEPVKISYCPLNDPVDIFLSGVPMKYDSAGSSETFRTAGMFRLEAKTYSGKQVALKEGEQMRMDMPTVDPSDTYNFYTFNEKKGAWTFTQPAPAARDAIEFVMDTLDIEYDFDATAFTEKFDNPDYRYMLNKSCKRDKDQANPERWLFGAYENKMRKSLYASSFRSANFIKLRPFSVVAGYDDEHRPIRELRFRIYTIGQGNDFFRELSSIQSFNFSIEGMEDIREFYKTYSRNKRYNDIRIEYEQGEEECTLILKEKNGFTKIQAKVHAGHRPELSRFAMARFNYAVNRIHHALGQKQEVHDKIISSRKKDFLQRQRWTRGRVGVWTGGSYRQLSLPGFNTYNCDQIARLKSPVPIALGFTDENGEDLQMTGITVCDTRVRATFSYYSGVEPMVSKNGFGFVLVTDADAKTYYLNSSAWKGAQIYALKELPDIANAKELRALLLDRKTP